MKNKKEYSVEIGGKKITATFSDLADQADGSVIVKCGETSVLATACMGRKDKEGGDYMPLTVDYEERFYATGKILGGQYIRREGRPTEEAILTGRVVDRTIRPLFDQRIRRDIQVIATVLSIDEENDPDTLAVLASSLALSTSSIPWNGPTVAVRVTMKKDGAISVNTTTPERVDALLDSLICGREGLINMIEAEVKEVPEAKMAEVFDLALSEIKKLEDFQKKITKEIGKEKVKLEFYALNKEELAVFNSEIAPKLNDTIFAGAGSKLIDGLLEAWMDLYKEKFPEGNNNAAAALYEDSVNDIIHDEAIKNDKRADGRKMDELRELYAQAGGVSSVLHGSGIFYRGGTHVLSALTLGGPKDCLVLDGMETRGKKYFTHHYNFPPYSSGETGKVGGTNRRMIGHGALAEKALRAIMPSRDVFPYTVRLVSESLASNGSTSMGSICASTLALMDGGVPIKAPVAGIAMGLMIDAKGKYKVLTDIQGPEDHHGDMDFKVAGTRNGLAAIQLDIKVDGVSPKILMEAIEQSKKARFQILDTIEKEISAPRADLALSAPRLVKIMISVEKIGLVIGPGGKMIHKITDDTGAEIAIEEDGSVIISGKTEGVAKAKAFIENLTHEFKAGERLEGEVVKIMEFGAFVNIGPDCDGLVHISELAPWRVEKVEDLVKVGMRVPIYVKEKDDKGRLSLSIKKANPDFFKDKAPKA